LIARFCDEGLLSPIIEQRDLLSHSEHRPGDVTLPNWKAGLPLAIDVAVTSPYSVFGLRSNSPADAYSDVHKHGKYASLFRGKQVLFSALVLESTGGSHQLAEVYLSLRF